MADSLIDLLRRRTVLVRTKKSVGTGTLIAPGLVLTCAHVIRQSVEREETIKIRFPNAFKPGHFLWTEMATSVHLSNKYEEQNSSNESGRVTTEYPDVAIIEIARKDHALIRLAEYVEDSADSSLDELHDNLNDLNDKEYMTFGFQKRDRELGRNVPQAVSLNFGGVQLDGYIRKLMFTNGLIRPGMSGAALVERESGQVLGIVHMTMSTHDDLGAYVIPIGTIWSVIKEWEDDNVSNYFSVLSDKELRKEIRKQYAEERPQFSLFKEYGYRLIVLLILMFLTLSWLFYHFGQIQETWFVSGLLIASSVIGKLTGDWLGKKGEIESRRLKLNIGKLIFSNTFLMISALLVAFLWTFTTSIWVYGDPTNDDTVITLYYGVDFTEGHQKKFDANGRIRFSEIVSPFGDTLTLVAKGREPKTMSVTLFKKKEFKYPEHFDLEPAVFIRLDPRYHRLLDKYAIVIEVERSSDNGFRSIDTLEYYNLKEIHSLMLGQREINITKEQIDEWKEPFKNEAINRQTLDLYVNNWRKFRHSSTDIDVEDRVRVKVIKKEDSSLIAEEVYSVKDHNLDKLLMFK